MWTTKSLEAAGSADDVAHMPSGRCCSDLGPGCDAAACALYYNTGSGGSVCQLTSTDKHPDYPDEGESINTGTFTRKASRGSSYGAMLEGWLRAPAGRLRYKFFTNCRIDSSLVLVAAEPNSKDYLQKMVELNERCSEVEGTHAMVRDVGSA